jgi:hypothetical protein
VVFFDQNAQPRPVRIFNALGYADAYYARSRDDRDGSSSLPSSLSLTSWRISNESRNNFNYRGDCVFAWRGRMVLAWARLTKPFARRLGVLMRDCGRSRQGLAIPLDIGGNFGAVE